MRVGVNLSRKGDPMTQHAYWKSPAARDLRARCLREGTIAPLETEPRYMSGEVMLTLPSVLLLQALADFPRAMAPSVREWVSAARTLGLGHMGHANFHSMLCAAHNVHPCWVVRRRVGRRVVVQLTRRGRAIINRQVASRVVGRGPYTSLQALRASQERSTVTRDDLAVLEQLAASAQRQARASAPYTPSYSAAYRRISVTIAATLNARVATEFGLVAAGAVRAAAQAAVAAIDNINRFRVKKQGFNTMYAGERAVLRRLAEQSYVR